MQKSSTSSATSPVRPQSRSTIRARSRSPGRRELDTETKQHDVINGIDIPRDISQEMMNQLINWIRPLPKYHRQKWMKQIYVWNQAHAGCHDNDLHWTYADEEPGVERTFAESLVDADVDRFATLFT
jgi:hypothetical protein